MKVRIDKVAVIGAGTMGQGIAQSVAMAGYKVMLYDINQPVLDGALKSIIDNLDKGLALGKVSTQQKATALQGIEITNEITKVVADLVIEAVVENPAVKIDLFRKLESINPETTIFATNTSSIPVSQLSWGLKFPNRLGGLHFFNPAHIMKLVEVIQGDATDPGVIELLTGFAKGIGKIPVQAKDTPGFIVNRVARHYYLESLHIVEKQVADFQVIDELLEGYGFRMGPFRLMDLIGIDVNLAVTKSIYESFQRNPKFKPSNIQEQMVTAGNLGRKSGTGFYSYK